MGTHPIFESDFDCLTEMIRLLSFDAMDTLIKFRGKPGSQYLQSLQRHGIGLKDGIEERHVFKNFNRAYKEMNTRHPVYGFYTQIDTQTWWRKTFMRTVENVIEDDSNMSDLEEAFLACYHNFEYGQGRK